MTVAKRSFHEWANTVISVLALSTAFVSLYFGYLDRQANQENISVRISRYYSSEPLEFEKGYVLNTADVQIDRPLLFKSSWEIYLSNNSKVNISVIRMDSYERWGEKGVHGSPNNKVVSNESLPFSIGPGETKKVSMYVWLGIPSRAYDMVAKISQNPIDLESLEREMANNNMDVFGNKMVGKYFSDRLAYVSLSSADLKTNPTVKFELETGAGNIFSEEKTWY